MNNKKNIQILLVSLLALVIVGLLGIWLNQRSEESATSTNLLSSAAVSTSSSAAKPVSIDKKVNSQATLDALALPQLSTSIAADEAEVEIQTSAGNIDVKLFPKLAPLAVQNFLAQAKAKYYNNNEFFRVIKNFMVQTGDPTNTGTSNDSLVNSKKPFATEISNQLYNIRGALSLANTGSPDSSASQFFIVENSANVTAQLPTSSLYPTKIKAAYKSGGYPSLDGLYTVFGQVVSGMDVVDKIANGAVTANPTTGENSVPTEPYSIITVKILKDWNFSK